MKVLSNTTTTTRAVLQAVSDGQWWRKSLTYLRPLQASTRFLRPPARALSTQLQSCPLQAVPIVFSGTRASF